MNSLHTITPTVHFDIAKVFQTQHDVIACGNCMQRAHCLSHTFSSMDLDIMEDAVEVRKTIKRGMSLFRSGEPFVALYAIRTGFFKTIVTSTDGRDQVTGFHMAGEMLGLDGFLSDQHHSEAIALEDAEICMISSLQLESNEAVAKQFQKHVFHLMSSEIVREQNIMLLLGHMRAEERVATFLINLVKRLHDRGYSRSELVLRMTRDEIGSYLGLKLETVSRVFSKLSVEGVLDVNVRRVKILNDHALQQYAC